MSHDPDPAALRELLGDAVADVAPRDRLGEIRRRTSAAARRRPRWPAVVLGAGTATAAVVAAVAVTGQLSSPDGELPDRPAAPASSDADAPDPTRAGAVYFVGDTPLGERLFREFQPVTAGSDPESLALSALRRLEVDSGPDDPDYRTVWPDGSFTHVTVGDDRISVEVTDAAVEPVDPADRASVVLAVQQAVHTAEAAAGNPLPVVFERRGTAVTTLLGAAVAPLVARAPGLLAPVNISDPAEGREVRDTLRARGVVAPQDPADLPTEVAWQLHDSSGVVASGTAPVTAISWETRDIDLSGVPAGTYVLSVRTTPGDGEDGQDGQDGRDEPVAADTRTITVR